MNVKTIGLKVAGGLLAAAFVVTALAGHAGSAAADPICKPGPCPVDTRPDLVVTNFTAHKASWGLTWIDFDITNQGLSSTSSFRYKVLINGQVFSDNSVPSLAAGGVLNYDSGIPTWFLPAGCKLVSVQVLLDVNNEVNETNESNNTALTMAPC